MSTVSISSSKSSSRSQAAGSASTHSPEPVAKHLQDLLSMLKEKPKNEKIWTNYKPGNMRKYQKSHLHYILHIYFWPGQGSAHSNRLWVYTLYISNVSPKFLLVIMYVGSADQPFISRSKSCEIKPHWGIRDHHHSFRRRPFRLRGSWCCLQRIWIVSVYDKCHGFCTETEIILPKISDFFCESFSSL